MLIIFQDLNGNEIAAFGNDDDGGDSPAAPRMGDTVVLMHEDESTPAYKVKKVLWEYNNGFYGSQRDLNRVIVTLA